MLNRKYPMSYDFTARMTIIFDKVMQVNLYNEFLLNSLFLGILSSDQEVPSNDLAIYSDATNNIFN